MEIFRIIRTGAENGLTLWFFTVLPTLLPFMILSGFIYGCGLDRFVKKALYPAAGRVFGISPDSTFALFMGLAAGVPLGGSLVAGLVSGRRITRSEGQYLLAVSNNLSIPFIVSYACQGILKNDRLAAPIMISLYTGVIAGAFIIYRPHFRRWRQFPLTDSVNKMPFAADGVNNTYSKSSEAFSKNSERASVAERFLCNRSAFLLHKKTGVIKRLPQKLRTLLPSLDSAIMNGFTTITRVGGYIIIFSIMSELLQNIFALAFGTAKPLPSNAPAPLIPALVSSLLEITSGIALLGKTAAGFVPTAASFLLTFGGLCAAAQTKCVLGQSGLSIRKYLRDRLLAAVISACVFAVILPAF